MKVKIVMPLIFCLVSASALAKVSNNALSFLPLSETPDSLSILPPPPAVDSIAFLADKAAYEKGRSLKGTARWQQAINDADLSDANIGKPFSQALGVEISAQKTPITYDLLKKIRTDSGDYATKLAKEKYMRPRPFMFFGTQTCTPKDEEGLRKNGSYPSGHTAIGWTTALILTEIRPERANALLKRAYEFGQSRVICGAHWQSDVNSGVMMGASEVARLHADKGFMEQLQQAKSEIGQLATH